MVKTTSFHTTTAVVSPLVALVCVLEVKMTNLFIDHKMPMTSIGVWERKARFIIALRRLLLVLQPSNLKLRCALMSFRRTSGCLLVLSLVFSSAYTSNCLAKERAHLDYMLHCQGCHLPDGSGFPNKVPKLNDHVGKFLSVAGRELPPQVATR